MARIGTKKNPAVVRVQTEERAYDLLDYCTERGIQVLIGLEPDKDEDLTDLARALGAPVPAERRSAEKVNRNDPCPCGSGRKYKKCCLDRTASAG